MGTLSGAATLVILCLLIGVIFYGKEFAPWGPESRVTCSFCRSCEKTRRCAHTSEWGKVRDHDEETSTQHMRSGHVIKLKIQKVSVISSL